MKLPHSLVFALVALAPLSAAAHEDDSLVKFDGGIGVIPVSAGQGTDATATVVNRNIVRGVQPAGQLWRIDDFEADVRGDGRITVDGRGLVFAGGNAVGTALVAAPGLNVLATLICETVAPFVERNTNPVPLAANGDFQIDDVLSPPPPPSCDTPVLLIRNAGNLSWFAAGIQKFDDEERRHERSSRQRR